MLGSRPRPTHHGPGKFNLDHLHRVLNVSQSYNYPPNRERVKKDITRKDLATHFAMYNK